MALHRDLGAVRQHPIGAMAELLDETEYVIPAAAVQTSGVVPQLKQNLVHFKSRRDRFNQYGGANRAAGNADIVLGEIEDVIPKPRFEMALHLGEIKIGSGPVLNEGGSVVKEIQAKIEQRGRYRLAARERVFLDKVPSARPHQQNRRFFRQPVVLAFRTCVLDHAADGVFQIQIAVDVVAPGRRVRVLEIRHEDVRAGVQRVDNHFAVYGTCDLYATVLKIARNRRNLPFAVADLRCFRQKIEQPAGAELSQALGAALQ